MRTVLVDERDVTWERADPHFRAYVFEGAGNAVSAHDILDAALEQALDAALTLSNNDEKLWSLALIDDNSRGMRGLVWLSGMDYNDTPTTVHEHRQRREMQQRYLAARHRSGLPPVLPNGLRVIRLLPEWGRGWPLWESFTDQYRLTGESLGLSARLSEELYEWNELWQRREVDAPVPEGWQERGQHLLEKLRAELGGIAEVRPEFLR